MQRINIVLKRIITFFLGIGLTSMSCCDTVRLCISGDSDLIYSPRDLDLFLRDMEIELEILGKIHGISPTNPTLLDIDKRTTA